MDAPPGFRSRNQTCRQTSTAGVRDRAISSPSERKRTNARFFPEFSRGARWEHRFLSWFGTRMRGPKLIERWKRLTDLLTRITPTRRNMVSAIGKEEDALLR